MTQKYLVLALLLFMCYLCQRSTTLSTNMGIVLMHPRDVACANTTKDLLLNNILNAEHLALFGMGKANVCSAPCMWKVTCKGKVLHDFLSKKFLGMQMLLLCNYLKVAQLAGYCHNFMHEALV